MGRLFGFSQLPNLAPRYNIAPTQDVAVVRRRGEGGGEEGGRELSMLRWGLIPSWAKDIDFGAKTINARAETVAEKPSFRSAYKHRRCLLPADGYYEWIKAQGDQSGKQPYLFAREDGAPFAFAGLWERWSNPDGSGDVQSCTIVVREAGPFTGPYHHRMPVIVKPDDYGVWLGEGEVTPAEVSGVMAEPNEEGLITFAVSKQVNNVRNDSPACIEAIELSEAEPAPPAEPAKQGSLF